MIWPNPKGSTCCLPEVKSYTSSATDEKVKKKAAAKKSAREKREQAKHEFLVRCGMGVT
jgi:hypothetical protein